MSNRDKRWSPWRRKARRMEARMWTVHDETFHRLGMSPSYKPNQETAQAIRDTMEHKNLIGPYKNLEELFRDMGI